MLMLPCILHGKLWFSNTFGHFKLAVAHEVHTINEFAPFRVYHLVAREEPFLEVIEHSLQLLLRKAPENAEVPKEIDPLIQVSLHRVAHNALVIVFVNLS